MKNDSEDALPDFSHLTPDVVLNLVEETLGRRCSNLCRSLTSYINRVYEVELEEGGWVIAKFYRPGRWSREALQDEQDFLAELHEREIPVVAPMPSSAGKTLNDYHGIYFALFPKKGGRICDEPNPQQWLELGRLLARMHGVGALHPPRERIRIHPQISTKQHLEYTLLSDFVVPGLQERYETAVRAVTDLIAPLFDGVENIRIHGDCHFGNILQRPGEPFHLIDFDDMAAGPAVQDLWMLLPGHLRQSQVEMDLLLEGYETFQTFNPKWLQLIEPLRAMRFIHFTAWCARQKRDGGFARLAPGWGTEAYWQQEIHDLEQQRQEIIDALEG
ncbi:MAG TPA: serine/threonine protein kinase [Verrucomicrobia bacterium]|nr:MAG: stress response serine/threonine protein kinase YihE [Lentisphaerae bacterium GWF2_57_35]HBA82664.1 serine/threonine protein kinase [Verrucomicrobiota bacterium]